MQAEHQAASHAFTAALLGMLRKTENYLQRRLDEQAAAEMLAGLEVQDSDWGAWLEAGGDLLMGQAKEGAQ